MSKLQGIITEESLFDLGFMRNNITETFDTKGDELFSVPQRLVGQWIELIDSDDECFDYSDSRQTLYFKGEWFSDFKRDEK